MMLSQDDLRLVGLWAANCAERTLPLFEARAPDDTRPREAIEGIQIFARGGKRTARLRVIALAAHAAARDAHDPAATAAARAAGIAAAVAYTHPLATLDQAKHVLGPAAYAALARELASSTGSPQTADDDPGAGDAEIQWAIEHASPAVREVVRWFPPRCAGRSRLDALYYQLDAGLRG
jgi:hypothetical protein